MKNYDVIVAGAGPVGLAAALFLVQADLSVLVLEKRETLNQVSKASTFHPPTLDILDRLGVYEEFEKLATHVDRQQFRTTQGGLLGNLYFDLLEGSTRFPFRKHLEQSYVSSMLLDKLNTFNNFDIEFNVDVQTIIENSDTGVIIEALSEQQSTCQYHGRYLLGTDGAHSTVRTALGIKTEKKDYPGHVLRIRTDESLEAILPNLGPVTYLVNGALSVSFLRMPDCWRIILRVEPEVSEEESLSDEWILARLQQLIPTMTALPIVLSKDIYKPSMQVVDSYIKGNVVLCGDSAHLTNTRGGMNLNAGLHDAYEITKSIIQSIKENNTDAVQVAADKRLKITRDILIPRTDTMVSQIENWVERVTGLINDDIKAKSYLTQSAMIDMIDF